MTKETHPALRGQSAFLIESQLILSEYFVHCYINEGMSRVDVDTEVPSDLLEIMQNRELDSAILHTSSLADETPILEAHLAGRHIVVIKRNPPATREELQMYSRLEEAGVVTIEKTTGCFDTALERLSQMFSEAE